MLHIYKVTYKVAQMVLHKVTYNKGAYKSTYSSHTLSSTNSHACKYASINSTHASFNQTSFNIAIVTNN